MRGSALLLPLACSVCLGASCPNVPDEGDGTRPIGRPSIDTLAGQPIWSESVALDYLSDDGSVGLAVRLCVYPDRETGWLWAFVFDGPQILAFVDNHLPAPSMRHDARDEEVSYALAPPGPTATAARASFSRHPTPDGFVGILRVSAELHESPDPPEGPGTVPLQLEARFESDHEAEAPAPGRREAFGRVTARIVLAGQEARKWSGSGKWHEQHQEGPRWTVPFSYLAVQQAPGTTPHDAARDAPDGVSLLAVTSPAGTYGFLRRDDDVRAVVAFDIEPPADRRHFRVELADGTALEGTAERLRRFSVPIYLARREGSHVRIQLPGDEALLGSLNDWTARWK